MAHQIHLVFLLIFVILFKLLQVSSARSNGEIKKFVINRHELNRKILFEYTRSKESDNCRQLWEILYTARFEPGTPAIPLTFEEVSKNLCRAFHLYNNSLTDKKYVIFNISSTVSRRLVMPCPLDKYGENCEKSCHCSNNVCDDKKIGISLNNTCKLSESKEPNVYLHPFFEDENKFISCELFSKPVANPDDISLRLSKTITIERYSINKYIEDNILIVKYELKENFTNINTLNASCVFDSRIFNTTKVTTKLLEIHHEKYCRKTKPQISLFRGEYLVVLIEWKYNIDDFKCKKALRVGSVKPQKFEYLKDLRNTWNDPDDSNRVVLTEKLGDEHSDYINASYVDGFEMEREFIAAQGPTKATINDFWRMIWECNTRIIVVLTRLLENGMRKCDKYWPEDSQDEFDEITVKHSSTTHLANYLVRTFELKFREEKKNVEQYHYVSWPDHGVPRNPAVLLDFWRKVKQRYSRMCIVSPILVHCSAGVGRTGTFMSLDYLINQANRDDEVDVKGCVKLLREQRIYSVQTLDQYIFLYYTLYEYTLYGETTTTCQAFHKKFKLNSDNYSTICKEFKFLKQHVKEIDIINECKVAMHASNIEKNSIVPRDDERFRLKSLVMEKGDYEEANPWDNLELIEPFTSRLIGEKVQNNIKITDFSVEWNDKKKCFRQIQFDNWKSDVNVPSVEQMVTVRLCMRKLQRKTRESAALVCCPNGANRSGTFCILNTILERLDLDREVDIFQACRTVAEIRPQILKDKVVFSCSDIHVIL
ncbi:DgyrCDS3072 [Dimorphilus gyrociliatus]|uniref:protein-tyrosine-phosphatase n=1 Tax=Dimorphilus gyrociliatus TaxID=2664684 RepID=A0A7I8VH67_9ANNE|nr:DgyrCDS3072 [Dimorphilus gyrociliatus]